MTLIVEDGTGLPNSNSYADATFADAYFLDRNNSTWAALSGTQKDAALIAATDYIDVRFGPLFKGLILLDSAVDPDVVTQALQFPRDAFSGVPINVKKATAEYAVRASSSPLAPDLDVDSSGFEISRKYEKVGPIEERTDFATSGAGSSRLYFKPYPAVDALLRPFFRGNGSSVIRN
jgi:hypothetical protein